MTNTTTTAARTGLLLGAVLLAAAGCAAPQSAAGVLLSPVASSATPSVDGPGNAGARQGGRAPEPSARPDSSVIPDPAAIPVHRALPAAPEEKAPPTRLVVAGTSIDVSVVAVGVRAGNQMEIPDSVDRAGWYRHGPAPGDGTGTAVIAAHVDTLSGLAPFSELRQLRPDTRIIVERADAETLTYRVSEVELMDKDQFDAAAVFRRDGKPQLKLVTCGGEWLDARQDYSHNVVVTAVPD
ncbi:class F sortase [Arthrobacter sp. NPDC089319]|uniref:class F sortase n=1 Tax=Arthrobacter sp. NPDC089319 TaxID=3155915 RepID=UPI00342BFE16